MLTEGAGQRAVLAHAPGSVNLVGEHTDYCGGLALPMAVDMGVTATLRPAPPDAGLLRVSSDTVPSSFDLGPSASVTAKAPASPGPASGPVY